MTTFLIRRLMQALPTVALISIVVFTIIQLPPGDYLTTLEADIAAGGGAEGRRMVETMRRNFGLDQPLHTQYFMWVQSVARGDFGVSFEVRRPVREVIAQPLTLSIVIALLTMVFMWVVAIPIGIHSATHRYSPQDHAFTFFGFLGLATPDFLFAMTIVVLSVYVFGSDYTGGLFSSAYRFEPWSAAKIADMLRHVWVPVLVIGSAGTAELIRVMRGNLIDVLTQEYVRTARAKGVHERVVVYKHAVRVAINPLVSIAGMQLPQTISRETVTAIVLGLPTAGPLLYRSLISQDMYVAGTILLVLSLLLVVGNILADVALAIVDPRVRYD